MTAVGYVTSSYRSTPAGNVVIEVVTDDLQRLFVQMPRARTSAAEIAATIDATIAGLAAKPSPVR